MNRREFLVDVKTMAWAIAGGALMTNDAEGGTTPVAGESIRLFLGGDVMTGRGIDQILPHPGDPRLQESFVTRATQYLELAEAAHGAIPRPAKPGYPWGDAVAELDRRAPDARIVNLETAVTSSDDHWPNKRVHYRMHPANIDCLTAAGIDCCVLANNHVLDWGYAGLEETLATLEGAGLKTAGAGNDQAAAAAPAVLDLRDKGRVLVFGYGSPTSGIPRGWAATAGRAGVNLLPDLSRRAVRDVAAAIDQHRQPGDIVIASIHWGGNWGYDIDEQYRALAHGLVDIAGVDLVHGHSSHHAKGIEVYEDRLIIYGCGDLLNDYEGIKGYEQFRDDLAVMYFADINRTSGGLVQLELVPLQIRNFRLNYPADADVRWLRDRLDRECSRFGHRIQQADGRPSVLSLVAG